MKAIILNSGIGSRLGKYTKSNPKCMVELKKDLTIIKYQLQLLKRAQINEIIITTGYMQDMLIEHLEDQELKIEYIYNEDYELTNYIKSLDNIGDIEDDIVLMHGDLVFEASVLSDVLNNVKSCMVIDRSLELPKKDFKAVAESGKITYVGTDCFENAYAAQPLYKLNNSDWKEWKKAVRQFCIDGRTDVYAENALNTITDIVNIYPLDVNGRLCSEVDNEEDLLKIRELLNRKK